MHSGRNFQIFFQQKCELEKNGTETTKRADSHQWNANDSQKNLKRNHFAGFVDRAFAYNASRVRLFSIRDPAVDTWKVSCGAME